MVVVILLGILALAAIVALNPTKQLNRAKDAERLHALQQIRNALDTYYNDHNAYPSFAALPESTWKEGLTVYMQEVPVDPDTKNPFPYEINSASNLQWAVVYAKLSVLTASCPLTKLSNCLPTNFNNNWSCLTLGNIDTGACSYISSQSLSQ